jgi:hypothetical protein
MNDDILIEARKTAERAVSDMSDQALKLKAFEVILARLLAQHQKEDLGPKQDPKQRRAPNLVNVAGRSSENSKRGRILRLRENGFFEQQRTITELRDELRNRGWIYQLPSLSGPLQQLVQQGALRRALVNDGKKKIYKYVNP